MSPAPPAPRPRADRDPVAPLLAAVARLAAAGAPQEVAGLVWRDAAGALQAEALPLHSGSTHHFELAPGALRQPARSAGRWLAWFHSHPLGPPEPSETDRRAAVGPIGPLWPGMEHWIAAPCGADGLWTTRRFHLSDGHFRPIPAASSLPAGCPGPDAP